MLFGPNIRYFNELEINGEHVDDNDNEDFTKVNEDDDMNEDDTASDENDDLTDYTEEEFDDTDDDQDDISEEDNTDDEGEDDLTDYTEEEFDDTEVASEVEEDNTEVASEVEEDETNEESDNQDNATEDNLEDFTEEEFDDTEETSETDGDNNADNSADDNADDKKDTTSDEEESSDNEDDNTLASMEKNLFSDLTPQQMTIKNNELFQNYIDLYETINTIFDSVNKIPKTFNNTRPLTFIADQLVNLKDMVNYIITTTYITRTYVENMTYYKQALVVLEQINTMLKALVSKSTK